MKVINRLTLTNLYTLTSKNQQKLLWWSIMLFLLLTFSSTCLVAQTSQKGIDEAMSTELLTLRVLELPANVKLFDKTEEDFFKQLDNWDSIPDEILERYIFTLADRAVVMENQIITDYQKNAYHLSLLRENLAVFSKNKKENKAFIANTKEEIARVKALDKTLLKVKNKARSLTNCRGAQTTHYSTKRLYFLE
jgi:hypothetical protein